MSKTRRLIRLLARRMRRVGQYSIEFWPSVRQMIVMGGRCKIYLSVPRPERCGGSTLMVTLDVIDGPNKWNHDFTTAALIVSAQQGLNEEGSSGEGYLQFPSGVLRGPVA